MCMFTHKTLNELPVYQKDTNNKGMIGLAMKDFIETLTDRSHDLSSVATFEAVFLLAA
jgi:hypothetical protein